MEVSEFRVGPRSDTVVKIKLLLLLLYIIIYSYFQTAAQKIRQSCGQVQKTNRFTWTFQQNQVRQGRNQIMNKQNAGMSNINVHTIRQ